MGHSRPTVVFGKEAINMKSKSATIAFFSSPPFLCLALFFALFFSFVRYCFWSFSGIRNLPF